MPQPSLICILVHFLPNRIGVIGFPSGGHLALMLGMTYSSDGLEGKCGMMKYSSRVQAVVSLAGVTDLKSNYIEATKPQPDIKDLIGGTPEEMPERYTEASPLTYVSENDPPVLTIQGDRDPSVAPSQAVLLDNKMKEVGASHTLIIKKGIGHGVVVDNDVWGFFDKHLKGD